MCPIAEHLVENGFEPVLFYPKNVPSKAKNAQQPFFQNYAYAERLILNNVIYPFLEANPCANTLFVTPHQLCKKLKIQPPREIDNINNPAFFQSIDGWEDVRGSFSLRCTQMFKEPITRFLKSEGRFLLNLHSGILPEFRGLYSTPREMAESLKDPMANGEFGCTLHHIDAFKPVTDNKYGGIDTGNIVTLKSQKINPSFTVYHNNILLASMGAGAVIEAVNSLVRGESLRGYPQDNRVGRYYSYADADTLKEWENLGIKPFTLEEVIHTLVQTFSHAGTAHAQKLTATITKGLATHFNGLISSAPPQSIYFVPGYSKGNNRVAAQEGVLDAFNAQNPTIISPEINARSHTPTTAPSGLNPP
jgi:hypothetical protein